MDELFERLQAALPERYTLVDQIGRGGMSTVYLARERHPNRQVAVKVLDPAIAERLGRERFLREIDFVSNLTHPHIVPIFAAGNAEDLLFYVMPYVEGESLSARIRKDGRMDLAAALRIARSVASALEYAHRRNVLHRDIKPDNILLHDGHPLVTDFGVARAIRAADDTQITEVGLTLGTPAYMSPEQAGGAVDIDGRTDIYSLGCVLYNCLTGVPPFSGTPEVVLPRHITERPTPLRSRDPSIPEPVDAVVLRALAKEREQRYRTAAEFEAALDELYAAVTSGSHTRISRVARRRGRTWRVGGALAVLIATMVLSWEISSRRAYPALSAQAAYVDSIAILPAETGTEDSTLERLADAVTYGAISQLSRIPEIKVSSYHSVRTARQDGLDLKQVAESMQVRLVVASQFRSVGDQTRFEAELLDPLSGQVLRSGTWWVDVDDERTSERGLVSRLVELVGEAIDLSDAPVRTDWVSGPAHDVFLLGTAWLGRRTPVGVKRAIAHFHTATSLDSSYASAWAGLSSAYSMALAWKYEIGVAGHEAAGRALAAANRAIELDPLDSEGYSARGFVISRSFGPLRDAAADFRRAQELSPNSPKASAWSGLVLALTGRAEEAMEASRRGAELDPLSPARYLGLAYAALPLGEYNVAAQSARRATELEPELVLTRAVEGRALVMAGRAAECLTIEFGAHEGTRALCLHALGRVDEAEALVDSIARSLELATKDSLYTDDLRAEDLACYYAWTGDVEKALEWIDRAYALSPMGIERRWLETSLFDSIRNNRDGEKRLSEIGERVWQSIERHSESVGAFEN